MLTNYFALFALNFSSIFCIKISKERFPYLQREIMPTILKSYKCRKYSFALGKNKLFGNACLIEEDSFIAD